MSTTEYVHKNPVVRTVRGVTVELWYENLVLHRFDGPAIKCSDGHKEWYMYGQKNREGDMPTIEYANGAKAWHTDDLLHRTGGPAVEYVTMASQLREWREHGALHRTDGPAYEYVDSEGAERKWYVKDVAHNLDGPAVICIRDSYTRIEWCVDGLPHRMNGPAIEESVTGAYVKKEYYDRGRRHRRGAAALEYVNLQNNTKYEEYWENGIRV